MNKAFIPILIVFLAIASFVNAEQSLSPSNPAADSETRTLVDIEVFVREGCPHCARAKEFLAELSEERPNLRISIRDIGLDSKAYDRLKIVSKHNGLKRLSVPTFVLGDQVLVGFSDAAGTGKQILDILDRLQSKTRKAPTDSSVCTPEVSSCNSPLLQQPEQERFEIDFLGHTIGLEQTGLPLFTIAMGLLDGFNPCSMWVLILMISLLAPMRNRWRMLAVAGTFIAVEGLAYFMFMAAWLNLFLLIGLSRASVLVIAAIALLAGAINIKDFFAYGKGLSLSIPESARPGIYARIRAILQAQYLRGAIIGAMLLAVLVQIVEFLCTSGFPALYTRILTLNQLSGMGYYGYLLLYNAAYMLDDVIVLGIGIFTLSQRRLQEKEGRWLKLFSGVVMMGLGLYLLVN